MEVIVDTFDIDHPPTGPEAPPPTEKDLALARKITQGLTVGADDVTKLLRYDARVEEASG